MSNSSFLGGQRAARYAVGDGLDAVDIRPDHVVGPNGEAADNSTEGVPDQAVVTELPAQASDVADVADVA